MTLDDLRAPVLALAAGQPEGMGDVEDIAGVLPVRREQPRRPRVGQDGVDDPIRVGQRQAELRERAARGPVEPVDDLEQIAVAGPAPGPARAEELGLT